MVDREVFDRRLARLELLLGELRKMASVDAQVFLGDTGLQAQVERWTHLAVESCLDLANHLIADRGWPTTGTYRGAFELLAQRGVIEPELARKMAGWAGLRNILVHMYLDIDHQRLLDIVRNNLGDLEEFACGVQRAADDD